MKIVLICISLFCFSFNTAAPSTAEQAAIVVEQKEPHNSRWLDLARGLSYAEFDAPYKSNAGDSLICVLKIDPAFYKLTLLCAAADAKGVRLSAKDWSVKHNLIAAINPSMYQEDYRSSVSLMKTGPYTNNAYVSKDKTILVFDSLLEGIPDARLIDRDCDDFTSLKKQYLSFVQSIRMISCKGENVWQPQDKQYSTSSIAEDKDGNILFIHARSPFSTHTLIRNLMVLPLNIKTAMYTEGGPEAQLYIKYGEFEKELIGSFDSALLGKDTAIAALPIPNIIGIVKKEDMQKADQK